MADTQQFGDLQDVQDEEGSEGEEEDSESMPCASNNFNFPPDIVARFEEGYRSNPAAGMEAMRKTYVSLIFRSVLFLISSYTPLCLQGDASGFWHSDAIYLPCDLHAPVYPARGKMPVGGLGVHALLRESPLSAILQSCRSGEEA